MRKEAGKTIVLADRFNNSIKLTIDIEHAKDSATVYLSKNEHGKWIVTPKVYPLDKVEVGRYDASRFEISTSIGYTPTSIIYKLYPNDKLLNKRWQENSSKEAVLVSEFLLKGGVELDDKTCVALDKALKGLAN